MSETSVYRNCGQAARRLLADPRLVDPDNYGGIEGVFTEIDVILLASEQAGGYNSDFLQLAQREASQAMGYLFREGQVVRFGPVRPPGFELPDYLRIDSKIVYAGPDGPTEIHTPNGIFPRMFIDQDSIVRVGRRQRSNRSDIEPWAAQLHPAEEIQALKGQVARLENELAMARAQLSEARRITTRP